MLPSHLVLVFCLLNFKIRRISIKSPARGSSAIWYRVSHDMSSALPTLNYYVLSSKHPCATASDLRNRGLSNSWPAARDYYPWRYCCVSSLVLVFTPLMETNPIVFLPRCMRVELLQHRHHHDSNVSSSPSPNGSQPSILRSHLSKAEKQNSTSIMAWIPLLFLGAIVGACADHWPRPAYKA